MDLRNEWELVDHRDLWVINKLILATRLGYLCGPAGVDVPIPGEYIVRPCMNLMGMGLYTRNEYLSDSTDHLHPGEFWCEIFKGPHMSVDYHWGECDLTVIGERDKKSSYYKWDKWYKVEEVIPPHPILEELVGEYEWINCEFVDGNLIEVQFHRNSDFQYGNTVAIPVWQGGRYVESKDFLRNGFVIY